MCPYKLFCGHIQCVRTNFIIAAANALGIGAASFASHAGRGAGMGMGKGSGNGNGILGAGWRWSEQRYSGKPDGVAGTPKEKKDNKSTRQRVYKLLLNKICTNTLNVSTSKNLIYSIRQIFN